MKWPRFEEALAKHHELEQLMADPVVIGDRTRYTHTAKEHGALAKMIKPYLEYRTVSDDVKCFSTWGVCGIVHSPSSI